MDTDEFEQWSELLYQEYQKHNGIPCYAIARMLDSSPSLAKKCIRG